MTYELTGEVALALGTGWSRKSQTKCLRMLEDCGFKALAVNSKHNDVKEQIVDVPGRWLRVKG